MTKIICWGTGKAAREVLKYPVRDGIEISFLCTNSFLEWGSRLNGYEITSPLRILENEYDYVLILCGSPRSNYDIWEQLIDMGVSEEKIVFGGDLLMLETCPTNVDEFFKIKKQVPNGHFDKNKKALNMNYHGESYKARERREREGFFKKFCNGEGLDIGYGGDPITLDCCGWDSSDGDAQYLKGIENETFDFVYSSHCLEHMRDVREALSNWYRVLKPNGYLILYIPERDLYEKKKCLPSRFNHDHKHMFLMGRKEEPHTLDIIEEINSSLNNHEIVYAKVCDYGHTLNYPKVQSDGEYSIEVVIRKLP